MIVLLFFAIVLGGANRLNAAPLAAVELAALPLLVFAGGRLLAEPDIFGRHRFALLILAAVCAVPLLQMIPLPPSIWQVLPGRDQLTQGLILADVTPAWVPFSMAPDFTRAHALALLPPVAMFLGVLSSRVTLHQRMAMGLLIAAVVSILIGGLQLLSGDESFYPYRTTDVGQVTGLFANRNHLAAFILITLPFAAARIGIAVEGGRVSERLVRWAGVVYIFAAIVALGVIRSRAGVVLALPAVGVGLLIAWAASGRGRPSPMLAGGALAAVAGGTTFAVVALAPLIARFDDDPDERFDGWRTVVEAAQAYLPLGSGIGSFDPVYRSVEPLERLSPLYLNHAHNEYLEVWLEAGWLGVALIMAFAVWWGRRSWQAWRDSRSPDRHMQRAASGAILLLMLHSAVDYPLRTAALAVVFALFAGILERASRPPVSRSAAPHAAGS